MAQRCIAYLRVSTPKQSVGDGFMRQLESCVHYARSNAYHIVGVFADACSGDGPMPNRSLAYIAAQQLRCPILAETACRWSRMPYGSDTLVNANVIFTSPAHEEFAHTLKRICHDVAGSLAADSTKRLS